MSRSALYRILLAFFASLGISVISTTAKSQALPSFRKTLSTQSYSAHYNATRKTANDQVIAAGYFAVSNLTTLTHPLVTRFNQNGDIEWSLKLFPAGGVKDGAVTTLDILSNGDILVAGYINTNKSISIQYPYEDAFVARISAAGATQWLKTYDRIRTDCERENLFRPFQVTTGPGNEIILAAEMFNCSTELETLVMMKLDINGNLIWSSSYLYRLNLTKRNGITIDQSRISFWGTSSVSGNSKQQNLDLLQFDYITGRMINRQSWELVNNPNDPENSLGGRFILHSKRLINGNILVYGTTVKAFDNFTPRRANFTVLEFNSNYQYINGYNIVPAADPNSTILLNITADENGMVLFNRLFKNSVTEYAYALGAATNGQMIHERIFNYARSNFTIPEPLQIFSDGSYAFVNIYGSVMDYYKLSHADQDGGCLGNTNPPQQLFTTEPVQYRPTVAALPDIHQDTITAEENQFREELSRFVQGNRFDLGDDQAICQNSTVILKAPGGFTSYLWNTGSTDMEISVQTAGIYYCTVTDYCGLVFSDTIVVRDVLSIELIRDDLASVCKNEPLRLQAESGFLGYRWGPDYNLVNSPGSQQLIVKPDKDTFYFVRATLPAGCSLTDTIRVRVNTSPAFSLGPDPLICPQDSFLLRAPEFLDRVSWSTGSTDKDIWAKRKGEYVISGTTSEGCAVKDTIVVAYKDCGNEFFMPNAFTPNQDGLNDVIRPIVKGSMAQYRFVIYNRWGQVIFRTEDPLKGWDGRINGLDQAPQTYSWVCMFQLEGWEVNTRSGTLTLIR